jgi:hypothetical protein
MVNQEEMQDIVSNNDQMRSKANQDSKIVCRQDDEDTRQTKVVQEISKDECYCCNTTKWAAQAHAERFTQYDNLKNRRQSLKISSSCSVIWRDCKSMLKTDSRRVRPNEYSPLTSNQT